MNVGVVIGRFQVGQLHEGHVALLSTVAGKCSRLVVLVGESPAQLNAHDPLPFFCREDAIKALFPQATILPLPDQQSDRLWSQQIDSLLLPFVRYGTITIYGGPDSAKQHYSGQYAYETLDIERKVSGTEIRKATDLGFSWEFRSGMIYASQQRFPTSYQAVDIAVEREGHVLLGRKAGEDKLRFPGGFVEPTDPDLERAATRELWEECGMISVSPMRYLGSARIDDWRYRSSPDKIMSALYGCKYLWGQVKAGDDLAQALWIPRHRIRDEVHDGHQPLVEILHKLWKGKEESSVEQPVPADG